MLGNKKSRNESGMAGEFFVMERLYRLGYEPVLTLGKAKTVDILASLPGGHLPVRISVKSSRVGGKWMFGVNHFAAEKNLFFVFLLYRNWSDLTKNPDVYVMSSADVETYKETWCKGFAIYYSPKRNLSQLERFKDNWACIESVTESIG